MADGESLFTGGVAIYGFYAPSPYLLELYGDPDAYQIAGLSAVVVAGAQVLGGVLAARIRGVFRHRASALIAIAGGSAITIGAIGLAESFWAVMGLTVVWGLLFSATMPIRQTFLNDMIPCQQRATILSFDSLMSSGLGPAGARPGRRRLGLRAVLRDVRRHRGARPPVPRAVPAAHRAWRGPRAQRCARAAQPA